MKLWGLVLVCPVRAHREAREGSFASANEARGELRKVEENLVVPLTHSPSSFPAMGAGAHVGRGPREACVAGSIPCEQVTRLQRKQEAHPEVGVPHQVPGS